MEPFKTAVEFLARTGPEVTGRGRSSPPGPIREMLERFLAGECSEEEKESICEMLRGEPGHLAWLAERLRRAEQTPSGESASE